MADENTVVDMATAWAEEAAKRDPGDEPGGDTKVETPDDGQLVEPVATEVQEPKDPLADLPEEFRLKLAKFDELEQQNKQLQHQYQSQDGRVRALQQQLNSVQEQAAEAAKKAGQAAPSQAQIEAAKTTGKWDELKKDFPEWGEGVEELLEAKLKGLKGADGLTPEQVSSIVNDAVGKTREDLTRDFERRLVNVRHEGWTETVKTPEFANWHAKQPKEIQDLAFSPKAEDAIRMLDLYVKESTPVAKPIIDKRKGVLANAASSRPGQSMPPVSSDDMTPEQIWEQEASKREKTRAARGF